MTLPKWLEGDLRTDHAGETGAVWIYRGILSISRDPIVCNFAKRHLITEKRHLYDIEAILEPARRSWLLPLWRVAGFITGALPSMISAGWVFYTIEAVEIFVNAHYKAQIDRLKTIADLDQDLAAVHAILVACRMDEIAHCNEAYEAARERPGSLALLWCALVTCGSQFAVKCARWI